MSRSRWKVLPTGLVVGTILVISGCLKTTDTSGPVASSNGSPPDMGKGPGGAIRQIMFKIGKGPQQLDANIGKELQSDSPPWETLQKQASEYKQLTGDLTKHDPPRGTKESWQEKTTAFAEAATALDRASQAKDLAAAKAAQDLLSNACMQCHNEHKRKGKGG